MKLPICDSLPLYLAVPLGVFSHTAASGAFLQNGGTSLSDSSNLTLTVGVRERVFCAQATGTVPTSIEWYNPQDELVSKDLRDAVNQAAGGSRIAHLNFQSYQQTQGRQYECRVTVPRNILETLSVCVGEFEYLCFCKEFQVN